MQGVETYGPCVACFCKSTFIGTQSTLILLLLLLYLLLCKPLLSWIAMIAKVKPTGCKILSGASKKKPVTRDPAHYCTYHFWSNAWHIQRLHEWIHEWAWFIKQSQPAFTTHLKTTALKPHSDGHGCWFSPDIEVRQPEPESPKQQNRMIVNRQMTGLQQYTKRLILLQDSVGELQTHLS